MRGRGLLDCEVMRAITRHARAPYNQLFSSNICKALKDARAVLRTLSETVRSEIQALRALPAVLLNGATAVGES